jgi:excisionase family DNA binding protein
MSEQKAAARLNVHPTTPVCWRKRGLIGFIQHGRQIRCTEQHLLDYLAQQEVRPCRDPQEPTAATPGAA